MVIAQSAEGLMKRFLSERKGKGLKFALNVKFRIKNYFFITKFKDKDVLFVVVGFKCSRKRAYSDFLQNK